MSGELWFLLILFAFGLILLLGVINRKCVKCNIRTGFDIDGDNYSLTRGMCSKCAAIHMVNVEAEWEEKERLRQQKKDQHQVDLIARALDQYYRTHPNSRNL